MRDYNASGKKPTEKVEEVRPRKAKLERLSGVRKHKKAGEKILRKTGIDILGDAPWGTHFCVFYQSKQDLIDILVPYFKAGLESNEFCMWVTSEPLSEKDAEHSIRKAVPDFDEYLKRGQIEILPSDKWYLEEGTFDLQRVLNKWLDKLNHALARGYDGMRVTGNTAWLEKKDWKSFVVYEEEINKVIGKYSMMAICTYWLDKCGASEILEVEHNHQFSLIKWKGDWKILESSNSNQLEARLAEQTMISEALERSKKEWVETFNAISDWVAMTDLTGRILRTNRIGEDFTGTPLEKIVGQSICKLVHGQEKQIPGCPMQKMLDTGRRTTAELKVPDSDHWLMVTVDPINDEKGKLIAAVHITIDITYRKKAEIALRAERDRTQKYLDVAAVMMVVIDSEGRVGLINKKGCQILGYSENEILGKNWFDNFLPERIRKEVKKIFNKVLAGDDGSEYHENPVYTKNGEERLIAWHNTVLRDDKGNVIATLISGLDVTEQRKAENTLRESEEKYRGLVENSPNLIAIYQEGALKYVNQIMCKKLGWTFQEMTSPSFNPVEKIIPQRFQSLVKENIAKRLRGENIPQYEISIKTRDGLEIPVIVNAQAILYNGKLADEVIHIDITERKKAEQKLLDYQGQLRSLTSEVTLAEESERRRIAEGLHDQVSQSLVSSKIELDALRHSVSPRNPGQVLKEVSDSLGKAIDDIRSLTFDLSFPILYELGFETAVAAWLVDQIQEKHGITTEFEEDKQPKPLDDDVRVFLFRDLRELLINVVKHAQAKKIKVSIRKVGSEMYVSVEDDGRGFDLEKIAATAVREGGFGLFSIRERLEQLGGRLEIESVPGCGTKVTLIAPLRQEKVNRRGKK